MSSNSDDEDEQPGAGYKAQKAPATSAPKKPTGRKISVDDDEDSEVEMLSISSGDEDTGKDPKGRHRGRSRGRGSKDDDGPWDGEEPGNVLMKLRVRESRTAPVAQKFDRKPTAAVGRMLNNLQSFPRGMECVDPLGLGNIDNKTLRLITESSDSSPTKRLYCSGLRDLEAGALALKTDLKGGLNRESNWLKTALAVLFLAKPQLTVSKNLISLESDIESKLKRIEEDPEGSGTTRLFNCMQGVSSLANRAFEPLFERQAQAEKIRYVQGMLQRFRTLFNLPTRRRGDAGAACGYSPRISANGRFVLFCCFNF
ncbi:exocyst complex component 2 [Corchorus olitorius]|uniref:Exocyst complex component SEC5 n=1 Tax=Corchorus olitorius TaxID=93759 RepID=A0A1R3GSU3_9ROSI|nr:exocyst complex component 2 [Corchorus olitorius]